MDISIVVFTTDRQGHSGLIGNRSLLADSKHQRPEDGGASGRKFAAASLSLRPASRGWAASTDQLTSLSLSLAGKTADVSEASKSVPTQHSQCSV